MKSIKIEKKKKKKEFRENMQNSTSAVLVGVIKSCNFIGHWTVKVEMENGLLKKTFVRM